MKALVIQESLRKFLAARIISSSSNYRALQYGPVKFDDIDPKDLPGEDWVRVRPLLSGICGSDLSTVFGKGSRYFEPITSFPFTPGHEVVGEAKIDNVVTRVVVEPALHCKVRGLPECRWCRLGQTQRCESILVGSIDPGIQTGYCTSVGGGWSEEFVAHRSQLHPVPAELSDRDAVMIEPLACAVHSSLRVPLAQGATVAVLGAGTIGLLTVAALRSLRSDLEIVSVAKYANQKAQALRLGANSTIDPNTLVRYARSRTSAMSAGRWQSYGFDTVFDCVGTESTIEDAMAATTPGGAVVVSGMPSNVKLDLAPLWHREIRLVGSYAYGLEEPSRAVTKFMAGDDEKVESDAAKGYRTFAIAIEMATRLKLGHLVTHSFGLANYEEALLLAAESGSKGAIKVAFDPRPKKVREQENDR